METKQRSGITRMDIFAGILAVFLVIIISGFASGSWSGPAGSVGETGPVGETGETGATGEVNLVKGPAGPQGATGDKGARGEIGGTGPTGPAGAQGPPGAPGPTGDTGPIGIQGEQGITGETGDVGQRGLQGPPGVVGFLNPPPSALESLTLVYPILFSPDGVVVTNPSADGTEPANGITRRSLDLTERQAIRVQFAHSLAGGIQVGVEYFDPLHNPQWRPLIPATGMAKDPYTNQTSAWYSLPAFHAYADHFIRVIVYGDGSLDPSFTYISLDAK